jgi:hypothetical protein
MYSEGMIRCCSMVKSRSCLEARGAAAGTISKYETAFRQVKHLHEVRLRTLSTRPEMIANEHAKLTGTPVGTNVMRAFIGTTLFSALGLLRAAFGPTGQV